MFFSITTGLWFDNNQTTAHPTKKVPPQTPSQAGMIGICGSRRILCENLRDYSAQVKNRAMARPYARWNRTCRYICHTVLRLLHWDAVILRPRASVAVQKSLFTFHVCANAWKQLTCSITLKGHSFNINSHLGRAFD